VLFRSKEGGHNTSFLTRIAYNLLAILNQEQRDQLLALAQAQQGDIAAFARLRLPLIQALRRNLEGKPPPGSPGLDRGAVARWSADLYQLDGRLAFQRAQVMGRVLRSLNAEQRAALGKLKFGDSATWPDIPEPINRREMSHGVHVAVMTYAGDLFSWYAGSLEADTYFCPERHGMYFGGFGMKTAPAIGKKDYAISTSLTGNRGEDFLALLTDAQRGQLTQLVREQRPLLTEIVSVRRGIAWELRRFRQGEAADEARVLSLSRRYGELDGELSYRYAQAFSAIRRTLSADQQQQLTRLRPPSAGEPAGPFLYSEPVTGLQVQNSDFLFQR
jgi:Spy/CpxP family protein refolding chaperone